MKNVKQELMIIGSSIVVGLIILVISWLNTKPPIDASTDIVEVATKLAKYDKNFAFGDKVQVGNYFITINKVKDAGEDDIVKPKDGYMFYAVEATIENQSSEAVDGAILLATKLYVGDEFYNMDYNPPNIQNTLHEMIEPGQTKTGYIVFEIPKNSKDIELRYLSTVWNYRVIIDLGNNYQLQKVTTPNQAIPGYHYSTEEIF